MTKLKLLFIFTTLSNFCLSQKNIDFTGKIINNNTKIGVENASVLIINKNDSTKIKILKSTENGNFSVKIPRKEKAFFLKINALGYKKYASAITIENLNNEIQTIEIEQETNQLDEIIIKNKIPPIKIKKDTLEYNAKSFEVKPNSTVAYLLKKLPGMSVNANNEITVNGKRVVQVLVNGKPFFDESGKIVLENLPADLIDKVQISDFKTNEEIFKGSIAESNDLTLNLTIDEEKNKGFFGNLTSGTGSNNVYENNLFANLFKNTKQFSIIGSLNNGFENNNDGNGVAQNSSLGLNFSMPISKKIETYGSINNSNSENKNNQKSKYDTFLPDNFSQTEASSSSYQQSNATSMNFSSTLTEMKKYTLSYVLNISTSTSNTENTNSKITKNKNFVILNTANQLSVNNSKAVTIQNQLSYTRNFKKENRYLSFFISTNTSNQTTNAATKSANSFLASTIATDNRNINEINKNNTENYDSNISFIEPILDSLQLEMGINASFEKNKIQNNAFDFDPVSSFFNIENLLLTRNTIGSSNRFKPNLILSLRKTKISNRLGLSGEILDLKNAIDFMDSTILTEKKYKLFSINNAFDYTIARNYSINMTYDFSQFAPSISQLVTVPDFSNPLNTSKGNLDLEPTKNHNAGLYFTYYDAKKMIGINTNGSFSLTDNAIITKSNLDESLKSETTFINKGSNYSSNFGTEANKTFEVNLHRFSIRSGIGYSQNNYTNLTNDVLVTSINSQLTPTISFDYSFKETINFNCSYNYNFGKNKNDGITSTEISNKSHSFSVNSFITVFKNLLYSNDFSGFFNSDITSSFDTNIVLWNSSLNYTFLNNKLQANLKVFDLLKRNANSTRVISQNTVTDVQNNTISQYFMFSVIYNFKNF